MPAWQLREPRVNFSVFTFFWRAPWSARGAKDLFYDIYDDFTVGKPYMYTVLPTTPGVSTQESVRETPPLHVYITPP